MRRPLSIQAGAAIAIVLTLGAFGQAQAQSPRRAGERDNRPLKRMGEPAGQPAGPNPCAAYGEGFQPVAGSSTCVKLGGSVRVDAWTTRPRSALQPR